MAHVCLHKQNNNKNFKHIVIQYDFLDVGCKDETLIILNSGILQCEKLFKMFTIKTQTSMGTYTSGYSDICHYSGGVLSKKGQEYEYASWVFVNLT